MQHPLPLESKDLNKASLLWHGPLLFSLLDPKDPASQLLMILTNVLMEKSFIVVGQDPALLGEYQSEKSSSSSKSQENKKQ